MHPLVKQSLAGVTILSTLPVLLLACLFVLIGYVTVCTSEFVVDMIDEAVQQIQDACDD